MNQSRETNESSFSHETEVEPRSIAVATTTLYPMWYPGEIQNHDLTDKIRGDLALQLIKEVVSKGYQIALVDGESSPEFLSEVGIMGVVAQSEKERGMSGSRRQALEAASRLDGAKVICWTEPEKISIIMDCLPLAILSILQDEADIVVPSRNEASFQTYPDYQVKEEKRANRQWNNILRARGLLSKDSPDLDVWFGPKFFRNDPEILRLFLQKYEYHRFPPITAKDTKHKKELRQIYNPELWPNATFLPVVAALHQGLRVKSVPVSYLHPQKQTQIELDSQEYRRKRDIQRKNIIISTINFIRMLESNPEKLGRLKKIDKGGLR